MNPSKMIAFLRKNVIQEEEVVVEEEVGNLLLETDDEILMEDGDSIELENQ